MCGTPFTKTKQAEDKQRNDQLEKLWQRLIACDPPPTKKDMLDVAVGPLVLCDRAWASYLAYNPALEELAKLASKKSLWEKAWHVLHEQHAPTEILISIMDALNFDNPPPFQDELATVLLQRDLTKDQLWPIFEQCPTYRDDIAKRLDAMDLTEEELCRLIDFNTASARSAAAKLLAMEAPEDRSLLIIIHRVPDFALQAGERLLHRAGGNRQTLHAIIYTLPTLCLQAAEQLAALPYDYNSASHLKEYAPAIYERYAEKRPEKDRILDEILSSD